MRINHKLGLAVAFMRAVTQRAETWYLASMRRVLFTIALLGLSLVGAATVATAPVWKIGRAVFEWKAPVSVQIQPGQPAVPPTAAQAIPILKISLRNEGVAGNLPVQIFGRWLAVPVTTPPPQFTLLGTYQQQVALTQTAIVEAPLAALSKAPAGKLTLEISITTGGLETDRKSIAWN